MGIIQGNSRLSHHTLTTGGLTFSVPPQEDFTVRGTTMSWNSNGSDLALSEIGVNEADYKAYIRIGESINQIAFVGGTVAGNSLEQTLTIGNDSGANNIIMGTNSSINFGSNLNTGINSIVGGLNSNNSGSESLLSGKDNTNTGFWSIVSGLGNTNNGYKSLMVGQDNINSGQKSIIFGNDNNNTQQQSIVGGVGNANSGYGSIISGESNVNSAPLSIVTGNANNNSGDNSAIIGGSGNVNTGQNSVVLGGTGITATQSNTVYVPDLYIQSTKSIKSSNGGGRIDLDAYGDANTILITTDNADESESALYMSPVGMAISSNAYSEYVNMSSGIMEQGANTISIKAVGAGIVSLPGTVGNLNLGAGGADIYMGSDIQMYTNASIKFDYTTLTTGSVSTTTIGTFSMSTITMNNDTSVSIKGHANGYCGSPNRNMGSTFYASFIKYGGTIYQNGTTDIVLKDGYGDGTTPKVWTDGTNIYISVRTFSALTSTFTTSYEVLV